jgi:hypothetical protein
MKPEDLHEFVLWPGYPEILCRAKTFSCKFNLSNQKLTGTSCGSECMSSVTSSGSLEYTVIHGLAILDPEYKNRGSEFGRWYLKVGILPI